ncbi:MAG: O-antigen ligase family protein [Acidobacteriota bacterium]
MNATSKTFSGGTLFRAHPNAVSESTPTIKKSAKLNIAFAGLFLFTFLLYARPQEMFPEVFGNFPLVKIVAIGTLLAYLMTKLTAGERLTCLPLELLMVFAIALLGILFIPIAVAPQDSFKVLLDVYLKVIIIFLLMINLLTAYHRLRSLINLAVICGAALALFAIVSYLNGKFLVQGKIATNRIAGVVAGMFGNPNDLALSLNLLLPLAVALALSSRGWKKPFFLICAGLLSIGVIVTFSRGGFLGLVALSLVLLWKLSRRNRGLTILAFLIATGFFLVVMPSGYSNRITTIFSIEEDLTGSAQARRELLTRGVEVAANHLIIGVGMGNFHVYSIREQVAHNSYLEISAELGVAGLIAYLILIFSPFRSLQRIERQTRKAPRGALIKGRDAPPEQHAYYFSVALQASFVAYVVCSFFGSVQYLWHIYYLVAYAISLRTIYASEQEAVEPEGEKAMTLGQALNRNVRLGVLWKAHQKADAKPAEIFHRAAMHPKSD